MKGLIKRFAKIILFFFLILAMLLGFNVNTIADQTNIDLTEISQEEFEQKFQKQVQRFEQVKTEAIKLWDEWWFRGWFVDLMKIEYDYQWENTDPDAIDTLIGEAITYAKQIANESKFIPILFTIRTTENGEKIKWPSYALARFLYTNTNEIYCGKDLNGEVKSECINIPLHLIENETDTPFYKTTAISTMVHEMLHAVMFKLGWFPASVELPDITDPSKPANYIGDHCMTWLLQLGPSDLNLSTCSGTPVDSIGLFNNYALEFTSNDASLFDIDSDCINNFDDDDIDNDGITNIAELNPMDHQIRSKLPLSFWFIDSDMDSFERMDGFDSIDAFPTDPTEVRDFDNDGVGDMHDACPTIVDCDKDGVKDGPTIENYPIDGPTFDITQPKIEEYPFDGQPYNKYCLRDLDRDGLCALGFNLPCPLNTTDVSCQVPIDPNDDPNNGGLDSDGDQIPDCSDVHPNIAGTIDTDLKEGIHPLDYDDDGICNEIVTGGVKDGNGDIICKAENMADPCPWQWDCDGDWISDGNRIPSYIKNTISDICVIDKDGDTLCLGEDPNDEPIVGLDSDLDNVPDCVDKNPFVAGEMSDALKEGYHLEDMDDDGICSGMMDVKHEIGYMICKAGPDPCPYQWDCDNDGKTDGWKTPSYILDKKVYNLQPGPDPYILSPADVLQGEDIGNSMYIGQSFSTKMRLIKTFDVVYGILELGKGPQYNEYGVNKIKYQQLWQISENCKPSNDALLDYDKDGIENCLDSDIDGDGLSNQEEETKGSDPNKADTDCDGTLDIDDCEPKDHSVFPGAAELCGNGLDDDCDGHVDENCVLSDKDGDGWSDLEDNCPGVYNMDQTDSDMDGYGNMCDADHPDVSNCSTYDKSILPDGECIEECGWGEGDYQQVTETSVCGEIVTTWEANTSKQLFDEYTGECVGGTSCKFDYSERDAWFSKNPHCKKITVTKTIPFLCKPAKYSCDPEDQQKCTKISDAVFADYESNIEMVKCCGDPNSNDFATSDSDGDGLTNAEELAHGTFISEKDSDGDGCSDYDEVNGETNPMLKDCGKYVKPPEDSDKDGVLDDFDNCPQVPNSDQLDSDSDKMGDECDDKDNDGDTVEDMVDNCINISNPDQLDTDGDGLGNACDSDMDGDGVENSQDVFPYDPKEIADLDGDGIGNNSDDDFDGDGVLNKDDIFPFDFKEYQDTDKDGTGNNADTDDDNDGVFDLNDAFPLNSGETLDTDGDGVGNNADMDDDGDGYSDQEEVQEGSSPIDKESKPLDTDNDFKPNSTDDDDDNDGTIDEEDDLPLDATETKDFDKDGVGDTVDTDIDGDGVLNSEDVFPFDPIEFADIDLDGIGNVADLDDDNDRILDIYDNCESQINIYQINYDFDQLGDMCDNDDDNDGFLDENDNCSKIASLDQKDLNKNGIGDVCEVDLGDWDGDGIPNSYDNCKNIPNENQANSVANALFGDVCHGGFMIMSNGVDSQVFYAKAFLENSTLDKDGGLNNICTSNLDCLLGLKCSSINKCELNLVNKPPFFDRYDACVLDGVPGSCKQKNVLFETQTNPKPLAATIEICGNKVDEDFDGLTDEDDCLPDWDRDGIEDECDVCMYIPENPEGCENDQVESPNKFMFRLDASTGKRIDGCFESPCVEFCNPGFICDQELKKCIIEKSNPRYLHYLNNYRDCCLNQDDYCQDGKIWNRQTFPAPISISKQNPEFCDDGIDNNCNAVIDEAECMAGNDADSDGIFDYLDNCPQVQNIEQLDLDSDWQGDICDEDDDNDGISDKNDNCVSTYNPSQFDYDGDGIGYACDKAIGSKDEFAGKKKCDTSITCGRGFECVKGFCIDRKTYNQKPSSRSTYVK